MTVRGGLIWVAFRDPVPRGSEATAAKCVFTRYLSGLCSDDECVIINREDGASFPLMHSSYWKEQPYLALYSLLLRKWIILFEQSLATCGFPTGGADQCVCVFWYECWLCWHAAGSVWVVCRTVCRQEAWSTCTANIYPRPCRRLCQLLLLFILMKIFCCLLNSLPTKLCKYRK